MLAAPADVVFGADVVGVVEVAVVAIVALSPLLLKVALVGVVASSIILG